MPRAATPAQACREERRASRAPSVPPTSADSKKQNFLVKLLSHLHNTPNPGPHDIRWANDGATLVVSDLTAFTERVIPTLVKSTSFDTFIRQMDIYGFSRCRPESEGRVGDYLWKHVEFDRSTPIEKAATWPRKAKVKAKTKARGPLVAVPRGRANPYSGWGGKRPGLDVLDTIATSLDSDHAIPTPSPPDRTVGLGLGLALGRFQEVEQEAVTRVGTPLAEATFNEDERPTADCDTRSVASDGDSLSFASLSSLHPSRANSPASWHQQLSPPTPTGPVPPFTRRVSLTQTLASFTASRSIRATGPHHLSISTPSPSLFTRHRSPSITVPSPLDPPSFPFPSMAFPSQLQSPPSSPLISIASEDSALRTPIEPHLELEEDMSSLAIGSDHPGLQPQAVGGRRATVGSMDRLPWIYESIGHVGGPRLNGMRRTTSSAASEGSAFAGQNAYYSPPCTASTSHPFPSSHAQQPSSILFGPQSASFYRHPPATGPIYQHQQQQDSRRLRHPSHSHSQSYPSGPPSPYYVPTQAPRLPPRVGYATGVDGHREVRRIQSAGNLMQGRTRGVGGAGERGW